MTITNTHFSFTQKVPYLCNKSQLFSLEHLQQWFVQCGFASANASRFSTRENTAYTKLVLNVLASDKEQKQVLN